MTKLFEGLIGKVVRAYIDDTIVKSTYFSSHLSHLELDFQCLACNQAKLNPTKYKFRVKSRIFLGHIINRKGIRAHPDLVKAIEPLPKQGQGRMFRF